MNPTSKFTFAAVVAPVVAAVMEQLQQKVEAKEQALSDKDAELARSRQALAAAEAIIQQLKEAIRLERIGKYGKQSEKLTDLQLELLDHEPAVSSEEIDAESQREPLREEPQSGIPAQTRQKNAQKHPGRHEHPSQLERIEEIVACATEHCTSGKSAAQTT